MLSRYLIKFNLFKGQMSDKESDGLTDDIFEALYYVDFIKWNSGSTWIESELFDIVNEFKKKYPDITFKIFRNGSEIIAPDFAYPMFSYSASNHLEETKYEVTLFGDYVESANNELMDKTFTIGPNPIEEIERDADGNIIETNTGNYSMTYKFIGPY